MAKIRQNYTVTDKHILFWGSVFSNFAETPFVATVNDKKLNFRNSEQYFMYVKAITFGDDETAELILKEGSNPARAKQLGRKVKNYDDNEWNQRRYAVMCTANLHKYQQNSSARKELLKPELRDKSFVEASPYDRIWGIGLGEHDKDADDETKWKGRNLLGQVLDEIREKLLSEPTQFDKVMLTCPYCGHQWEFELAGYDLRAIIFTEKISTNCPECKERVVVNDENGNFV